MKFCKDCQYFSRSNFCRAPQNGVSPIDGRFEVWFATTSRHMRESGCGPEAHYFKQKHILPKPWWKIWS